MIIRPRRLRTNESIRSMVRETRISADSLILPLFLEEGENIKNPIPSMEGHYRYSPDRVAEAIEEALKMGVGKVLLFGIPKHKDEYGSSAYDANGVVQRGIRKIKEEYSEMYIITDVCMCEYTSHGHCGIVEGCSVDNDKSLQYISDIALSHVIAGADMVAPSDMMDGRVGTIRQKLDLDGFKNVPIMSYSVKYASSFYGPFREAAGSAPGFGDRRGYQMDYHNRREAVKEAMLDIDEGADILMVKPALAYLDIVREMREVTNLPIAAYSVSGEYAMTKAAARMGYIDEYGIMCESAASVFRAGADILITYYANELAQAIKKGDIG